MKAPKIILNPDEEMMILQFWAHGMDIAQKFSTEQIRAVPGLEEAIAAVSVLPKEIGWGDEPQKSSRQYKKSAGHI
ncbi:hypothetical protein [Microvirga sp. CF3016]|uniref:hypothetical protein n=1 Tax=Microvirga sp. CF3016 TaxID=3110181 RepID=UPI002E7A243C|nr:hypothetical protein [Microvirga sp. CF3016]MEE1613336.1 hypothetical protein [Microvirga sp. CF3016]